MFLTNVLVLLSNLSLQLSNLSLELLNLESGSGAARDALLELAELLVGLCELEGDGEGSGEEDGEAEGSAG